MVGTEVSYSTRSVCRFASAAVCVVFFFQAEDGIRDLVRSRGLGDVYKRQVLPPGPPRRRPSATISASPGFSQAATGASPSRLPCLLYTSDAADERSSVDLGGRRIIKKKTP